MRHGSEAFRRPMLLSLAAKKFIALSFICEKLVKYSFSKLGTDLRAVGVAAGINRAGDSIAHRPIPFRS
jgi:hypothetical protein